MANRRVSSLAAFIAYIGASGCAHAPDAVQTARFVNAAAARGLDDASAAEERQLRVLSAKALLLCEAVVDAEAAKACRRLAVETVFASEGAHVAELQAAIDAQHALDWSLTQYDACRAQVTATKTADACLEQTKETIDLALPEVLRNLGKYQASPVGSTTKPVHS